MWRHSAWSNSSAHGPLRYPERITPHIPPDGTRLAWIAPHEGALNVWAAPIGASGVDWESATVVTAEIDRGIRFCAFARDDRHLLVHTDTGGDENWWLYDVDWRPWPA